MRHEHDHGEHGLPRRAVPVRAGGRRQPLVLPQRRDCAWCPRRAGRHLWRRGVRQALRRARVRQRRPHPRPRPRRAGRGGADGGLGRRPRRPAGLQDARRGRRVVGDAVRCAGPLLRLGPPHRRAGRPAAVRGHRRRHEPPLRLGGGAGRRRARARHHLCPRRHHVRRRGHRRLDRVLGQRRVLRRGAAPPLLLHRARRRREGEPPHRARAEAERASLPRGAAGRRVRLELARRGAVRGVAHQPRRRRRERAGALRLHEPRAARSRLFDGAGVSLPAGAAPGAQLCRGGLRLRLRLARGLPLGRAPPLLRLVGARQRPRRRGRCRRRHHGPQHRLPAPPPLARPVCARARARPRPRRRLVRLLDRLPARLLLVRRDDGLRSRRHGRVQELERLPPRRRGQRLLHRDGRPVDARVRRQPERGDGATARQVRRRGGADRRGGARAALPDDEPRALPDLRRGGQRDAARGRRLLRRVRARLRAHRLVHLPRGPAPRVPPRRRRGAAQPARAPLRDGALDRPLHRSRDGGRLADRGGRRGGQRVGAVVQQAQLYGRALALHHGPAHTHPSRPQVDPGRVLLAPFCRRRVGAVGHLLYAARREQPARLRLGGAPLRVGDRRPRRVQRLPRPRRQARLPQLPLPPAAQPAARGRDRRLLVHVHRQPGRRPPDDRRDARRRPLGVQRLQRPRLQARARRRLARRAANHGREDGRVGDGCAARLHGPVPRAAQPQGQDPLRVSSARPGGWRDTCMPSRPFGAEGGALSSHGD
mmetsp:Transcript_17665/g.56283  ORF Transcript_17665/g.56283 Transcript_17665/m.56283 type:complete len:764 (-) Transcript_17665:308-2599(-)